MGDKQDDSVAKTLESIKYYSVTDFQLLDQRLLPHTMKYDAVKTTQDAFVAIKEMRVRGAPAIAVTAALAVAVEANAKRETFENEEAARTFILESLKYIQTSRPTAVNLSNAVTELCGEVQRYEDKVVDRYIKKAEDYFQEDVAMNTALMKHGADHILQKAGATVNLMTICNTGALATSRYGTALGVVRQLHYTKRLNRLFALETRPWNQGARLTIFECMQEKIPATLIVDSAASSLMAAKKIDAIVVGADRICQNGDTANKIGTYNLAVAAKFHGVPFYVAAPTTTLDPKTTSGASVVIEERETTEITHNTATKDPIVALGETISVWNPVFDITPGELITGGIITEKGVVEPKLNKANAYYDIAGILAGN